MARLNSSSTPIPTPLAAAPVDRDERTVRLGDLGIARENLRFNQPADDDVPLLAATLKAAGQLERLTVRPGRGRKEDPFMVLNGRRRLLALGLLLEAGDIAADYPVRVYVETDPERQAAAALLTNTAVPVHVADVILAIGRMLKAKFAVPAIARALGYGELEIRRLAALSSLPPVALDALRQGCLMLKQARLLVRLADRDEQIAMAEQVLNGHGFQEWRITERLGADRVTARDRRCGLVAPDAYTQAGGRTETDLFGELPPVLLDPEILTRLWMERAEALARVFETEGLTVHVTAASFPDLPEDLEPVAYVYGQLDGAALATYRAARDACFERMEAVREAGASNPETRAALVAMIRARVAMDRAGSGDRDATVLVLSPSGDVGVEVQCYGPQALVAATDSASIEPAAPAHGASRYVAPRVEAPDAEIDGVSHALHAMRTDVATRGLIRSLADDPGTALVVLVARLFSTLVAGVAVNGADALCTVKAAAFASRDDAPVEALDGVVRDRLEARRIDWEASGQTVLAWVGSLAHGDRMAVLAELTAISLDGREARTDLIRPGARSDAAELAQRLGADITHYWTPDARFLRPHPKPLLLSMLTQMGADDVAVADLKKDELSDRVADEAAARCWAPSVLSWCAPGGEASDPQRDEIAGSADRAGQSPGAPEPCTSSAEDDGTGAFLVTPEGLAALQPTAA